MQTDSPLLLPVLFPVGGLEDLNCRTPTLIPFHAKSVTEINFILFRLASPARSDPPRRKPRGQPDAAPLRTNEINKEREVMKRKE